MKDHHGERPPWRETESSFKTMFSDTFPIHFHVNEPLAKDHPYIKDQICLIFRVALRPDLLNL